MKKFLRLYDYLDRRESYSSTRCMLEAAGLFDLTQQTAREVLMVSYKQSRQERWIA